MCQLGLTIPFSQLQKLFRHAGIEAMLGSLTRSIAELNNGEKPFYDDPASFHLEDPVVDSIKGALERLTYSTRFLSFLSKHALIGDQDELPSAEDEAIEKQYDFMALVLNLMNTFLYMVNTYIVVPSADKYAISLGAAPTLCGVIIGSMAVAQLISSVYFSSWSNRSYFKPLFFSSVVLLLGNMLYAVAYDFHSLSILIAGRLLCGLGSARAVNRRYITDWVPINKRLQASAAFVTASALVAQKSSCGDLHSNDSASKRVMSPHGPEEQSLLQPLTETAIDIDSDLDDTDNVAEESEYSEEADKPANSFCEALQLLTNPVKVQLGIYFMLKYAMEIILSESSVVTTHYFGWTTGAIAMFVALLGFTVLPVNFLIGVYISNLFEDRQILVASEVMTCVGLATLFAGPIPYTKAQYMTGALIGFVSTEVLEGVNLSLLSKVMSPRLAKGTYNNGLLSTEAGTLARVVADGTITLAGYCGINLLLNLTLTPALAFALISLIATFFCYNSLY
ncbi:hypothetical protein KP509_1Z296300 [Ceratopteris richardii]|nr:hypothetical protein KP509_1Z296300 [Ceratopteris richardii]KAH6554927.1 hypothetical protein KP509_1Z296300 [Ceratopteris richardii]